ncbi:hypothetical protein RMSM_05936 [Rhodopirellula maiorica SM1]|uniref:Uncharacterized protein n=1 Tax=Rhodopirellula maiorica SM1 TaxID=1265738 RepID=M5RCN2_9BACT|nr:hypothetical protein RMSM_05936 [Rhodopirellula maiorica SM1]
MPRRLSSPAQVNFENGHSDHVRSIQGLHREILKWQRTVNYVSASESVSAS